MSPSQVDSTGYRGSVEGGNLKEEGTSLWASPNTGANNTTGFSALPGGYRNVDGSFNSLSFGGRWWSTSVTNNYFVWYRALKYSSAGIGRDYNAKNYGYSVRCLKD